MPDQEELAFLARQTALVRDAVELVRGDIERTTALRPDIQVTRSDGLLCIRYFSVQAGTGSESSVNVYTDENPAVLVAVADHLQDDVSEELHAAWPVCDQHGFGAHALVRQDSAVWWCRHSEHTVAQIGSLARPERVP